MADSGTDTYGGSQCSTGLRSSRSLTAPGNRQRRVLHCPGGLRLADAPAAFPFVADGLCLVSQVDQSVRTTDKGGLQGFDGFKKISGRKRHLLTDATGLVMKAKVHTANLHDATGARLLLPGVRNWYERLQIIWADQGYRGADLSKWVYDEFTEGDHERKPVKLEIVRRSTKDEVFERATQQARERLREGATIFEAWGNVSAERSIAF